VWFRSIKMKKYTVIYLERVGGYSTITLMKRVEFDESKTNLTDHLKSLYLLDDAVFIFEGHPKLEGESATLPETNVMGVTP
jgi:hypothetical protein